MKKKITAIAMTLIVGGSLYFTGIPTGTAHDTGAPAGYTNSPYDKKSCTYSGCHDSYVLQSPQPTWITTNIPSSGYYPDSVYTVTAKAVKIGYTSFGFEISPQTVSGSPLGTIILTNTSKTQIMTEGSLQYITHTINGYIGTDSLVWTFQWKAPSVVTDSVTFYGAFNCGNGTKRSTGIIYPAVLTVRINKIAGINTLTAKNVSFSLFPNPAKEQVSVTYNLKEATNIEVTMYDADGRKISNLLNTTSCEGQHIENLFLPSGIKTGIYFIRLTAAGQSTFQKIIVE